MSTTTAAPPRSRPSIGWPRQTLRLTRTEFTLFVRYKTAWMFLALPLFLLFVAMGLPSEDVFPGVSSSTLSMAATLGSIGVIVGVGHASNVFTARRESLVLKRLRVSGVPQLAIFGALTGVVVLFSVLVAVLMAALIFATSGVLPRDPLMLLLAVVLSALSMTLVGLLITPTVRNAEAAQMAAMVPMMILLFASGVFLPMDLLPDTARQVVQLFPATPSSDMAQAAYSGYDVFGGYADAEEPGYLGLWAAALPSVGVMFAWIAVLGLLVRRYFRWDPRQP
ncbi:ABC-2 type transport system permease protein [Nocardiopsis arvandica]|uniref:ABC-2 type transport system permease protein n=1 Tax=Nocardiopsis sinuspersici TaxID=501010 RepID=A0A7Y9XD71_9ACTN|nr:ABC transporter permease [Nocardiopsis sinuspersici]NYH52378.1 ABC-2 type transport system permease protein [Nocardiopsis sinuspersici]